MTLQSPIAARSGEPTAPATLRRFLGAGLARAKSLIAVSRADAEFDAGFYRTAYPDLASLEPAQLRRHYVDHGRPEGRFSNAAALIRSLEQDHEPLSPDFDLAVYRLNNPDIAGGGASDLELLVHYFKHGRAEGRTCSAFHPVFYRNLYHPDWPMDAEALEADWRTPRDEPRYASMPEMLDAFGFRLGPWISLVRATEFRTLNAEWAGTIETREQALLAFVREGWRRLAPLSLESAFDAAFYRETHPELFALDDAEIHDADLYRDWLLRGAPLGEPASVAKALQRLGLNLTAYPAAFPWQAYVVRHSAGADRWSALRHLVETGFDPAAVLVDRPAGRALLLALGEAYAMRGHDGSAIAATTLARDLAPLPPRTLQHLADAYFRLGVWREALSLYEEVVEAGSPTAWTIANGARCARELGDDARAFRLLERSRAELAGDQLWLRTVREVVRSAFDRQAYVARASYAEDRVAEGHAVLERAVRACAERLAGLAPLGVAIPASPGGRVVILANQDLRQCTHYRVEQKAELLETAGRPYEIFDQSDVDGFLQALPGSSAAIFYRLAALPGVMEAIVTARTLGVATYYEIDDLIFDPQLYPAPIETYGGLLSKLAYDGLRFGTPLCRAAMALCDYGLASTQPLADRMAAVVRSGRSFVVANGLDSLNQDLLQRPRLKRVVGLDEGEAIRIFYGSGTLAHNSDFLDLAGPALLELMEEDERVRLVIVGYLALGSAFEPFEDRIERHGFVSNARDYWELLEGADLNLAVLEPGAISDCKSEIKWLEAAVFAIPSVVTPTAAYRAVLTDGEDVLFAVGVEGWRKALRALVQDEALRERIGTAARVKAAERFSLEAGSASLERALALADAAVAERDGRRTKPRLMIVNVYFPPQTIGGATRVVRDNIDSWIASGAADDYEIAVVTTDHEAQPAGRLRVDSYRGLPVFRISTPLEINMDWRPLNPEIGWMFGELLALWRPELVHFHAPQRLTASCVEACRDAGVPYLATLHDAWWISDWQFLTDDDGVLQTPGRPLVVTSPTGISPAQSQARLTRLRGDLEGAQAVLAVSESFAKIYRDAGCGQTLAVPNGLPHLRAVTRRPSSSGRVRLGHLGSMSLHKGYHLIRAALQRGSYRNLELTIVDHARTDGVEHQLWGSTPVTIIGKVRQAAVDELYAQLDVLLAPSIWPESYGLVVREALSSGMWVVASDLGAMGEDVTTGVNGFVIDVSDADGLSAALDEIDRDPTRYLQPPLHRPKLRTADDQAADLLGVYETILSRSHRNRPASPEPLGRDRETLAS